MTKARLLPIAVCGLAALFACIAFKEFRRPLSVVPGNRIYISSEHAVIPAAVRALRPVYPYSVIPGGVYAAGELQTAMRKDHGVQQHYAGFDADRLQFVTVGADCYRYVSFRQGDRIYWTRKKLRIPKGEVLFTDGTNYARTRCGNRLSEQASPSLTSILEPPPEVLSPPPYRLNDSMWALRTGALPGQGMPEAIPEARGDLPVQSGPVIFPNTIPDVVTGASPPSASASGVAGGFLSPWLPLGFFSYGAPIKPASGGSAPVVTPPVVPVAIPEPDEVILVAAFLCAVLRMARPRSAEQTAARHIR